MAREMQCAEKSADACDKTAYLNDAISDDESCDCCTHAKAQRDDTADAAKHIYLWHYQFHWQHSTADKTKKHAHATTEYPKGQSCPVHAAKIEKFII